MAIVKPVIDRTVTYDESCLNVTWTGLVNAGDVGEALSLAGWGDKTFMAFGAFTGTASVLIQGSNNGIDWFGLSNRQGTNMTFTAGGMNTSQDKPIYVRPLLTAGAGALVSVAAACHRTDVSGMTR